MDEYIQKLRETRERYAGYFHTTNATDARIRGALLAQKVYAEGGSLQELYDQYQKKSAEYYDDSNLSLNGIGWVFMAQGIYGAAESVGVKLQKDK